MFEALVTAIVRFEDQTAAIFGKRGPDGGQDVRSGDGKTVYQAKHHESPTAAKAIRDALSEAKKLQEYRKRESPRYKEWQTVEYWVLATNAAFGSSDRLRWERDVVPVFAGIGLDASYWARADLDVRLVKYPDVDRYFFCGESRAFLSIPEAREWTSNREPFLTGDRAGGFHGRDDRLSEVRNFLESDHLFLVVHGPGGIGKTRFLLEAGEQIALDGTWDVLWANILTMERSSNWFATVVHQNPTLLLVDEPADARLLQDLAEQLGGRFSHGMRWKVAVAVRSPKDPVLQFLASPRIKMRVAQLELRPLESEPAAAMCADLLRSGPLGNQSADWILEASTKIAAQFDRHPVWVTLAVHLLEIHNDLSRVPQTADGLAASYLEEIVHQSFDASSDQIQELLRWIALLGTVSKEDSATIRHLDTRAKIERESRTRTLIASLVKRRALAERGANNRLVEIKPDVMRDFVLQQWLSTDVGVEEQVLVPSDAAQSIVTELLEDIANSKSTRMSKAILTALGRTEFLLRHAGQCLPLLDPFFDGTIEKLESLPITARISLVEMLPAIAEVRPSKVVQLCKTFREAPAESESVPGLGKDRTISRNDLIRELPWAVFQAAMGIDALDEQLQSLEELRALAEAEYSFTSKSPQGVRYDGKTALGLIIRTLEGGRDFVGDYTEAGAEIAEQLLADIEAVPPTPSEVAILNAFLRPLLSIERSQTSSEGYSIRISRFYLPPGYPAREIRDSLLGRVQEIIEAETTPEPSRMALWRVLDESHSDANRSRQAFTGKNLRQLLDELGANLEWAKGVLTSSNREIDEVRCARGLWDWHVRYENDPQLKSTATALEELYLKNSLAGEFEPLLNYNAGFAALEAAAEAKATELAGHDGPDALTAFVDRAAQFSRTPDKRVNITPVAIKLGPLASDSRAVQEFVKHALGEPVTLEQLDFCLAIAGSWVEWTRTNASVSVASSLAMDLVRSVRTTETRVRLLSRLYDPIGATRAQGKYSEEELIHLRANLISFEEQNCIPVFVHIVSWTIHYDWNGLKMLVEQALARVSPGQITQAVGGLVDALYWVVRASETPVVPEDLGVWTLNQLLLLPDIDDLGEQAKWHLEQFINKATRPDVRWLAEALYKRKSMELEHGYEKFRAIGWSIRLSRFTSPIAQVDAVDAHKLSAIDRLLDLKLEPGMIGYHIPDYLLDIDPNGYIVPDVIAKRILDSESHDGVHQLCRLAIVYPVGSDPWRTAAGAAIDKARDFKEQDRLSIFGALTTPRSEIWSGAPGQVPQLFIDRVEETRKLLASEQDEDFLVYWKWKLEQDERRLRDEEERAKEDRGE